MNALSRHRIYKTNNLHFDLTLNIEISAFEPSVTMTNHANQLPSSAQANSHYYCLPTGHNIIEIEHNQGVVKNKIRDNKASKQFISNSTSTTEAMSLRFGATKYFVQRSKNCKEADAGNTN